MFLLKPRVALVEVVFERITDALGRPATIAEVGAFCDLSHGQVTSAISVLTRRGRRPATNRAGFNSWAGQTGTTAAAVERIRRERPNASKRAIARMVGVSAQRVSQILERAARR